MASAHADRESRRTPLWVQALQQTSNGFVLLDESGRVLDLNPAAAHFLGGAPEDFRGALLEDSVQRLRLEGPTLQLQAVPPEGQVLEQDVQLSPPGYAGWMQFTVERLSALAAAYAVQMHPIDARKRLESEQRDLVAHLHAASGALRSELRRRGDQDALTGLLSRAAFKTELNRCWRRVRDANESWSLLFVDLDRFQIINDTAGHNAGDALLRWVAQHLRRHVPSDGRVARLGGDEFGVLLPSKPEAARVWAEDWLAQLLPQTFVWRGRRYDVRASIGVAALQATTPSVTAVMGQADVACYTAKAAGRSRVHIYHAAEGASRERHRELESAAGLRERLEGNQGVLYLQRVVALDEPEEQRYEVLVRLVDEQGQVVLPTDFVPAAEQFDLMVIVDRWVLESCLRIHGAEIARVPNLILHLNLSATSLNQPGFAEWLRTLLQASPVPPQRIVFEITETAAMANLPEAAALMRDLRNLGCALALDDFGVGLSSFDYLRRFPVDFVKIDGSFVQGMARSEVDRHIVRAIHEVALALGAQTIAESAESEETVGLLREMGILHVQGFGLHYPEPLEQLLQGFADPGATVPATT